MTPIGVWGVFVSKHSPEISTEQVRTWWISRGLPYWHETQVVLALQWRMGMELSLDLGASDSKLAFRPHLLMGLNSQILKAALGWRTVITPKT
jgi:hypothetical protein